MSDLNLPPDEQADHSGPIADPDSFGGDSGGPAGDTASTDDDRATAPEPGAVPPPD